MEPKSYELGRSTRRRLKRKNRVFLLSQMMTSYVQRVFKLIKIVHDIIMSCFSALTEVLKLSIEDACQMFERVSGASEISQPPTYTSVRQWEWTSNFVAVLRSKMWSRSLKQALSTLPVPGRARFRIWQAQVLVETGG